MIVQLNVLVNFARGTYLYWGLYNIDYVLSGVNNRSGQYQTLLYPELIQFFYIHLHNNVVL